MSTRISATIKNNGRSVLAQRVVSETRDLTSSDHPFDPLSSPRLRLKWFSKVLRLMDDLPVTELHDAYCWNRSFVIDDHIFGDP